MPANRVYRWEKAVPVFRNIFESIGALALLFIVFLIATFPVTWLLMLFLGNVGAGLSYWGTLPLGTVVSLLIGAASWGGYHCGGMGPAARSRGASDPAGPSLML
jgi:hypothetical protein